MLIGMFIDEVFFSIALSAMSHLTDNTTLVFADEVVGLSIHFLCCRMLISALRCESFF